LKGVIVEKLIFSFIVIFLVTPLTVFGVDCSQLTTQEEIHTLVVAAKEAYPLERSKISGQLIVSPCEKSECSKKNIELRKKKLITLHSLRVGDDKRTYFIQGENAPMCVVTRGIRKFKCSDCSAISNDECRSFNSKSSIEGTNLDSVDMQILNSADYVNTCEPYKKSKKFFKIIATKQSGNSLYDKIVTFYEQKRGVFIKINYYAENVLRKVYRFTSKKYVAFDGRSLATEIKVRSTQGSEKKYSFETKLTIGKTNNKLNAYANPDQDPFIENMPLDVLFAHD
tara:strand:+ start:2166 stop:3014 length:849 start_codon:yes stop_codon:yes gene_type:complete